jgi:hypothetical protein
VPAPQAQLWTISGGNLTPTDATKIVAVPGDASGNAFLASGRTIKTRLYVAPSSDSFSLSLNRTGAGTFDDAVQGSWRLRVRGTGAGDDCGVFRAPAGGAETGLLTVDNAGNETITGKLNFGLVGPMGYPYGWLGADATATQVNYNDYNNPADMTKPSWMLYLARNPDAAAFYHRPASAGPGVTDHSFQFTGVGNLTISGSVATKTSGTTWANPSDPRLKQDIAPYSAGLADVLRLEPITYRLKAQPDGPVCYGFDAERVRDVFPECVTTTRMKLAPTDEEETDGVLLLDIHPILVALVNAVKELAAKVK